ncbi:hypothetical protein ACFSR9_08980 [Deinococcus taklimakanensis]|uniref:Abi-like protein n=1 Tax=Deinococcus taklimakanensis TaxID=536443 RepID=A0ABW5P328_9DEIO
MSRPKVIFELTQPGTWLEIGDRDIGSKIEGFISSIASSFYGANAALWLFEDAYDTPTTSTSPTEREAENQRRREIQDRLRTEHGYTDAVYDQADLLLKREQWQEGKIPREIEGAFTFLHAHSFLYKLDEIGRFLNVLAEAEGVPENARRAAMRFDTELSQVREIRNSAAHTEDRVRGLGPRNKPIPYQPVEHYGISAPGGVSVISSLYNQTLNYTVADGHLVGIDVTPETLAHVQSIIQELLNALAWRGSARHYPS